MLYASAHSDRRGRQSDRKGAFLLRGHLQSGHVDSTVNGSQGTTSSKPQFKRVKDCMTISEIERLFLQLDALYKQEFGVIAGLTEVLLIRRAKCEHCENLSLYSGRHRFPIFLRLFCCGLCWTELATWFDVSSLASVLPRGLAKWMICRRIPIDSY
jgi:hypothetical protein